MNDVTPPSTKANRCGPTAISCAGEKCGRRRAGAQDLPEWNLQVAVLEHRVIEFRGGVIAERPGRSGGCIARHHQQERLELLRPQHRRRPIIFDKHRSEHVGEAIRAVARLQLPPPRLAREHRAAVLQYMRSTSATLMPHARDVATIAPVLVPAKKSTTSARTRWFAQLLTQVLFDPGGDLDREEAADATAVERQNPLHVSLVNRLGITDERAPLEQFAHQVLFDLGDDAVEGVPGGRGVEARQQVLQRGQHLDKPFVAARRFVGDEQHAHGRGAERTGDGKKLQPLGVSADAGGTNKVTASAKLEAAPIAVKQPSRILRRTTC